MKHKFIYLALAASLCSCSGITANESNTPATDMSNAIDKAIANGNLEKAVALCDSLNAKFPDSADLRRKTITQRASIAEAQCLQDIPQADAYLASSQLCVDSLTSFFKKIVVSAATGSYLLDKSLNPMELSSASLAVQPRVGNEDMPWMLLIRVPGGFIPGTIHLVSGATTLASVTAPESESFGPDSPVSLVVGPEIADVIAKALVNNPSAPNLKLVISGGKKNQTITLSAKDTQAIVRSHQLAHARAELRQARIDREALERRLSVARNQIANASGK